ncbi:MAG: pilus assembly protein TadG-related protein [Parvularculaceae bacterium]
MRAKRLCTEFHRSNRGAIAVVFAIMIVPLLAAVSFAVDTAATSYGRAALRGAADDATLAAARALSRNRGLSPAQATAIARARFDEVASRFGRFRLDAFVLTPTPDGDGYELAIDGGFKPIFGAFAGTEDIGVVVDTEARFLASKALEAALVLDTTFSMSERGKIVTLRQAASDMANRLMTPDADVTMSVVPFQQYVNVGTSRRGAAWLDAPLDRTERRCRNTYPNARRSQCTTQRTTCTSTRDGVTRTRSCTRRSCANVDRGDPVETCNVRTTRWEGCVGSRPAPLDAEDADFDATRVPGLLGVSCGPEILPLTDSLSEVNRSISALAANGDETYIASGVAWGLRALTSNEPFSEGDEETAFEAAGWLKALVLMTDGENTVSATYPRHDGNDAATANAKTLAACDAAKARDVETYTIAFEVSDAATLDLLRDCASAPSNFYDAGDAAALTTAFQSIADRLRNLALTR